MEIRMEQWLQNQTGITVEEAENALQTSILKVKRNVEEFSGKFPAAASKKGIYPLTENDDWTNGFWTGEIWLSYEETKDKRLKQEGFSHIYDFLRRIEERVVVDHHDMGFLYSPSCVAAYRLFQNSEQEEDRKAAEIAKTAAIYAADNLMNRFQEKGQFFQAWGKLGDPKEYRLIIDCLLNMPLLFWASEVTGEECYRAKAAAHIQTAMTCAVRPDFSTYHTYYFDPDTGKPVNGVTRQGNRNNSIWARGQAWGIYGSALSYGYLKNPEYLKLFEEITACFCQHLPTDLVPYWDFDFTDGSPEPRDSSAAAIAACGLLEMAGQVDQTKKEQYHHTASCLLKALTDHCLAKKEETSNGILLHGTYAKASKENGVTESGVDECNLWGDYFYMEALVRYLREWKRYW